MSAPAVPGPFAAGRRDGMRLEVRDVEKSFRRLHVLRGVSFDVGAGEIVGLVGENGSGKSTLLRILAGLVRSDRGQVAREGTHGYCPQEPLVFDALTPEQNVLYFSAAYGLDRETGLARGYALAERLNAAAYWRRPAAELSGGTRQKLNLLVALLHEPDLLLLDEPYQGFDFESYLAFWELARELRDHGRSVLLVTHLVHERADFARLYRLEDGRALTA